MNRHELLTRYRNGADAVYDALEDIMAEELDRRPAATAWTPRQIVHHLSDSETHSYVRLRKLVAEDETWIQGYDQEHWARVLHYDRPIEASLAVIHAVRAASADLLERLTDADFERAGSHSERGRYSMAMWLADYVDHPYDHADQIARARKGEV